MSSAVAHDTVTSRLLAALSLTSNTRPPSSSPPPASAIDSTGVESSSAIVALTDSVSAPPAGTAFDALLNETVNVSAGSFRASSVTATVIVRAVTPAANVSVPLPAV